MIKQYKMSCFLSFFSAVISDNLYKQVILSMAMKMQLLNFLTFKHWGSIFDVFLLMLSMLNPFAFTAFDLGCVL
jgi:hypothetical protein